MPESLLGRKVNIAGMDIKKIADDIRLEARKKTSPVYLTAEEIKQRQSREVYDAMGKVAENQEDDEQNPWERTTEEFEATVPQAKSAFLATVESHLIHTPESVARERQRPDRLLRMEKDSGISTPLPELKVTTADRAEATKRNQDNNFLKQVRDMRAIQEKIIEDHPEWQENRMELSWETAFDPAYIGQTLGMLAPHMLGAMSSGAIGYIASGGNPVGAGVGAFGYTYAVEGGEAYKDALEGGLSVDESIKIGRIVGVINGGLEMLPMSNLWKKAGLGKIFNKVIGRKLVEKEVTKATSNAVLSQIITETLTEVGQEFTTIMGEKRYRDVSGAEIKKRLVEVGYGGGIGGLTMGTGGKIVNKVFTKEQQDAKIAEEEVGETSAKAKPEPKRKNYSGEDENIDTNIGKRHKPPQTDIKYASALSQELGTEVGVSDLSDQELKLKEVSKKALGVDVVMVDGMPHNGAKLQGQDGVIFVDRKASNPLMTVIGHELIHDLEATKPELYKELLSVIDEMDQTKLNTKIDALGALYDLKLKSGEVDRVLTRDEMTKEVMNDFVGEQFQEESFWEKVEAKSPELMRKLIQFLKKVSQKMTGNIDEMNQVKDLFKDKEALDRAIEIASSVVAKAGGASVKNDTKTSKQTQFQLKPDLKALQTEYEKDGAVVSVYETASGDIKLNSIIVPKENRRGGVGSSFMEKLVAIADRTGKRIILSPGQKDDHHGTTSRSRLVKFYKRFGFTENKGREKDFRISESMIREPKSNVQFQVRQLEKVKKTPEFKKWSKDSVTPMEPLYHGTTHDIEAFSPDRGNETNSWGKAYYFTTSPEDASINYAGENAPDLTSRIGSRAELILDDALYGDDPKEMTEEEAYEQATKELHGGAPNVIPAYVKMKKPFDMSQPGYDSSLIAEPDYKYYRDMAKDELDKADYKDDPEGWLEAVQEYADESYYSDAYPKEQGEGVALLEATEKVLNREEELDFVSMGDVPKLMATLRSDMLEGLSKFNFVSQVSESVGTGEAGNVVRMILEEAGYDGIIEDAYMQYGQGRSYGSPMKGIDQDTRHHIVFKPEQIKSVYNKGTFSDSDPRILHQLKAEDGGNLTVDKIPGEGKMRKLPFQKYLNKRALDEAERLGVDLTKQTKESIDIISNVISTELKNEVGNNDKAVGWYSKKVVNALDYLSQVFPELKSDPVSQEVFKVALAITSNGTAVPENLSNAISAYETWKETGKFPRKFPIGGPEAPAMAKSFKYYNELVEEMGVEDLHEFLNTEYTVKEMKDAGYKVNDEAQATRLMGSVIFGSKIGGGFLANLNGHFDALTMDRWFMRTVGRIRGDLVPGKSIVTQLKNFRRALMTSPSQMKLYGLTRDDLNNDAKLIATAKKVYNLFSRGGFKKKTKLNNASRSVTLRHEFSQEVPKGGSDRQFLRKVMNEVVKKSKIEGLTVADAQAIIWFPEKRFYAKFGATSSKGQQETDYEIEAKRIVKETNGTVKPIGRGSKSGLPSSKTDGKSNLPTPKKVAFQLKNVKPWYYSGLTTAVENLKQNKAPRAQWIAVIRKQAGVKKEELAWSGVEEWLQDQDGSVTKEAILDYLKSNEIQIEETMLGGKGKQSYTYDSLPHDMRHLIDQYDSAEINSGQLVDQADALGYNVDLDMGGNLNEITKNFFQIFEEDGSFRIKRTEDGHISPKVFTSREEAQNSIDEYFELEDLPANVQSTKFSGWVTKGGEDYRELLLRLPVEENKPALFREDQETEALEYLQSLGMLPATGNTAVQGANGNLERNYSLRDRKKGFVGNHFPEENILAHVRFDTRTDSDGRKVLHIAEVQSDWHQKGREGRTAEIEWLMQEKGLTKEEATKQVPVDFGYQKQIKSLKQLLKSVSEVTKMLPRSGADIVLSENLRNHSRGENILDANDFDVYHYQLDGNTEFILAPKGTEDVNPLIEKQIKEKLKDGRYKRGGVPNAPFKTTWSMMAMKRMIRYASENGYDAITWDTGETNVKRYNDALQDAVDTIDWEKTSDGIHLTGFKNGNEVVNTTEKESALSDAIGKTMGKQILESNKMVGRIRGANLVISDTGMAGFYDRMLPSAVNKYVKKWGAKVGMANSDLNVEGDQVTYGEWKQIGYDGNPWTISAVKDKNEYGKLKKERDALNKKIEDEQGQFDQNFDDYDAIQEVKKLDREMNGLPTSYEVLLDDKKVATFKVYAVADAYIKKETAKLFKGKGKGVPMLELNQEMKDSAIAGQPLFQLKREIEEGRIELDPTNVREWVGMQVRKHIRTRFQDKMAPLEHVQNKIGDVREEVDALLESRLYIGRATEKIERMRKRFLDGKDSFMARLTKDGFTVDDIGEYLYARHARERNAEIADRRLDMQDGGSGMSNEEAQAILDGYKGSGIAKYAKEVDDLIREAMELRVEQGLVSQETADTLAETYKYYVPLKGKDGKTSFGGSGQGFSVPGKDIKRAKGRESRADNPFVQAVMDYEMAVMRSEKNQVTRTLMDLALENPDDRVWEIESQKFIPRYNRDGEVEYADPKFKVADNVAEVKVDGKVKYITIHDEALAKAFKNLGAEKGIKVLQTINAYLRAMNTTLNPEFLITNFERDLQTALINISGEKSAKLATRVAKGVPSAMKGVWQNVRDKDMGQMAIEYQELKDMGGKVGWFDQKSFEEKSAEIQKLIKQFKGGSPSAVLKSLGKAISDMNEMIESGVRLSAYVEMKKMGVSKKKSAEFAKNLTVDFNRKGDWGSVMNSLYLFANAGVQGSYRIFKALGHKKTWGYVGAMTAMAYAQSWRNRQMSDDWDDYDDYVKDNYWLWMMPDGKSISVKVPYGYNIFKVAGGLAEEMVNGGLSQTEAMSRFLSAFNDAFNPLGGGSMIQFLVPTFADAVAQHSENKNFFGAPISPEQPAYAPLVPESQLAFRGVRSSTKEFAQWMNKLTGGSEEVSGTIDMNPEIIDNYIDFVSGGLGRFLVNSWNTGKDIYEDKYDFDKPGNTPMVRQIVKVKSEYKQRSLVYEMRGESLRSIYKRYQVIKFNRALDELVRDGDMTKKMAGKYKDEFTKNQVIARKSMKK